MTTYARYLSIAARALRDDILPTLDSSDARNQMLNCLRIISRVAMSLENESQEPVAITENLALPAEIREAFKGKGTIAPIAENVVLSPDTAPGIAFAANWLSSQPWLDDGDQFSTARALLDWESEQSRARHQELGSFETPLKREVSTLGETEKIGTALLKYLRRRFDNPRLSMREFRVLHGGRARMTALFLLDGHAEWTDWRVIHRDPMGRPSDYPGVVTQNKLMAYLHDGGLLVPRPLLTELDPSHLGAPFMIVERMPGSPPNNMNFFAPPPPSEHFAYSLAEQLGKLHALSPGALREDLPTTLGDRKDWIEDLDWLVDRWNTFNHGPSMAMSGIFAWMRKHVGSLPERRDVFVHGDMMQHNMLVEGNVVSALLDWESGRIGHAGEDIGYLRPMIEKLVPIERFMDVYRANGGLELSLGEVDYFTFRSYIWANSTMQNARNMFENGTTDDIRMAEVGASLAPQFLDCITTVFARLLQRDLTES